MSESSRPPLARLQEKTVAKPAPQQKRLRLYTEQPPKPEPPPPDTVACLSDVLRAFHAVTGCALRYEHGSGPSEPAGPGWAMPIRGEAGRATGCLVLDPPSGIKERGNKKSERHSQPRTGPTASTTGGSEAESRATRMLAGSIADLLGELLQTRHALRQREAELAAGVPVVPHREEEKHLAARLEAVLRAGVEAIDCHAAGALSPRRGHHRVETALFVRPARRPACRPRPTTARGPGRPRSPAGPRGRARRRKRHADLERARGFSRRRLRADFDADHAAGHALGLRE